MLHRQSEGVTDGEVPEEICEAPDAGEVLAKSDDPPTLEGAEAGEEEAKEHDPALDVE